MSFDGKEFTKSITTKPGVYSMKDANGQVIYVGKAKNLKKRLSSYFQKSNLDIKTEVLVQQISNIEVTVTNTEIEALLLENNLIKRFKPRYNVILRDDKSYPYIYISDHEFPNISLQRGKKLKTGRYFGPYPSASAVRESLEIIQKLFLIRPCSDSFFANRSRPCLQYQIKRCKAPCVNYVGVTEYQEDVKRAIKFLQGEGKQILQELALTMEKYSTELEFEKAALIRDTISNLQQIQQSQLVFAANEDIDIVAIENKQQWFCIYILFVRKGKLLGGKSFLQNTKEVIATESEVIQSFLMQYYIKKQAEIPRSIIISHDFEDKAIVAAALSEVAQYKVVVVAKPRGKRAQWLQLAANNSNSALAAKLASKGAIEAKLNKLKEVLHLSVVPTRLECFDISHTKGESTVASCVVFGKEGPLKSQYRRFNIKNITAGDDYGAMKQALVRRFKIASINDAVIPEVLFIDGGKGQLKVAIDIVNELQLPQEIKIVAIAKGKARKAGEETLIIAGEDNIAFKLDASSPALHLIQQIRDEAHRFAITGHRMQRSKARKKSILEEIEGVGAKRRRTLLQHFGSAANVANASIEELSKVDGISKKIAEIIYNHLH